MQSYIISYTETNYTQISCGHIFVRPDGSLYVTVGHWINGEINGQQAVNADAFRKELLIDKFNLPEYFPLVIDEHLDRGHDWSVDKII